MDSSKSTLPFSPLNPCDTGETSIVGAGEIMVVSYKECLKNHAASLGGHALDGCGEFMPSPAANPTDPSSLRCAACGCHRNFHRRHHSSNDFNILQRSPTPSSPSDTQTAPSPPPQQVASPVPCSFYASAPHVLFSLSSGFPGPLDRKKAAETNPTVAVRSENSSREMALKRRRRTKFTAEQKIKMRAFAEKAGWKINGCDEKLVREFCGETGITRGVLKVWMHNNKNRETSLSDRRVCLNSYGRNNGGENIDSARVSGDGSSAS